MLGPDWIKHLRKYVKKAVQKSGKLQDINKKCSLLITRVHGFDTTPQFIKKWDSYDDLMECCMASAWLPFLFGNMCKTYRNCDCIDGGLKFFFKTVFLNQTHIMYG